LYIFILKKLKVEVVAYQVENPMPTLTQKKIFPPPLYPAFNDSESNSKDGPLKYISILFSFTRSHHDGGGGASSYRLNPFLQDFNQIQP